MTQNTVEQWLDISDFDFSRPASISLGNTTPETGMTIARDPRIESGKFKTDLIKVVPESDFDGRDNVFAICQEHCTISKQYTESAQNYLIDRHEHGGPISIAAIKASDLDLTKNSVLVQIGPEHEGKSGSHFKGKPIVYPEGTSLWAVLRNVYENFNDRPEESPQDASPCEQKQPESTPAEEPGF